MIELNFSSRNIAKFQGFTILKKSEHIFHINDGTPSFVSLVIGEKRALLIDTSWGIKDLRKLVETLIDLPYTVVNTHGHPDHCYGNFQFDQVLIPERDLDVFSQLERYSSSRYDFLQKEGSDLKVTSFPPIQTISEGQLFDLGGITVKTLPFYGHTHGSLAYLVEEERILISGDALTMNPWLFMKEGLSLEECRESYRKAKSYEFDSILASHSKILWKKSLLDSILENIDRVLEGNIREKDAELLEIMGYKVVSVFCEREPGCWITVPASFYKE